VTVSVVGALSGDGSEYTRHDASLPATQWRFIRSCPFNPFNRFIKLLWTGRRDGASLHDGLSRTAAREAI